MITSMHNILFNQQMRPTQTMAHDAISVQSTLATRSAVDSIQDSSHCVQIIIIINIITSKL